MTEADQSKDPQIKAAVEQARTKVDRAYDLVTEALTIVRDHKLEPEYRQLVEAHSDLANAYLALTRRWIASR